MYVQFNHFIYRPEADDVRAIQEQLSSLHLVIEQSSSEHEKQLKEIEIEKESLKNENKR